MNFITALYFCLCSLTSVVALNNSTDQRFTGLDTAFARILKDWKAAGFAVAVVEKNKVVYARGFSYKNWQAKAK